MIIITRAQWGARPPRSRFLMATPTPRTWIHHTADNGPSNEANEAAYMRSIQNFHMNVRGWADIAYSFVIMPSGRIFEGRGWNVVGAHTRGHNSSSHGISFAGDFRYSIPSDSALIACAELLKTGIETQRISAGTHPTGGHNDVVNTVCPAPNLYHKIPLIRSLVNTREVLSPMYDPPLGPIAAVWQDNQGKVNAAISPVGDVYAWGVPWAGNVNGKSYWGNRRAAWIGPRDDGHPGYMIRATTGETYRLPDGQDSV